MKVNIDTSDMLYAEAWNGFKGTDWKNEINVRDFIQHNYTPYEGDESFLAEATPATTALWEKVMAGIRIENSTHAPVDFDTNIATTITAHDAGYINQPLEKIVGLQTDAPLKRALHPFGGINMIKSSFHAYGREMDSEFEYLFTDLRKTHNQGVFDAYTPEMKKVRHNKIITGLPDTYGRGRIVGDYRRVALYGIDLLIAMKQDDLANCGYGSMRDNVIRQREELAAQIRALKGMKEMAAKIEAENKKAAVKPIARSEAECKIVEDKTVIQNKVTAESTSSAVTNVMAGNTNPDLSENSEKANNRIVVSFLPEDWEMVKDYCEVNGIFYSEK